ncbi:glutathione S-transferase [Spatholobus suberectus]|nr:glutathione S-transferase [Spatholobus suberectus]
MEDPWLSPLRSLNTLMTPGGIIPSCLNSPIIEPWLASGQVPAAKAAFTTDKEERDKGVEESLEALQLLEIELKHILEWRDYWPGLLDIAAGFIAFWLPAIEEAVELKLLSCEKFPKLHKWGQGFTNHPVVKENLSPRDIVVGFFKARYAAITASK